MARFEREARVLASLNHPNIATIYGVEDADGLPAIAMELVDGRTLADILGAHRGAGKGLPIPECMAIARQIADALDAAHERGVVHRDLKPANIAITADGLVKVLDFGLAKAIGVAPNDEGQGATRSGDRTQEGVVLGTPGYMSPEQARGQPVDKRTDIWAFGCVVYEMLTGHRPFTAGTVSDTIVRILQAEPDWTLLPPAMPIPLRRLLERCLEKDHRRRQRDIGDARRDLDAPLEPQAAVAVRGSRSLWAVWVVAIVATAAAAIGWWRTMRLDDGSLGTESTLTRVTFDGDYAIEPALSPDGSLIVYASDAGGGGNLDLWLQRVGGGTPIRLTTDDADDHAPDFSPDGTTIAFRSERSGGGVYVMPALGGDARLIAEAGRRPRFSPDGTQVVYWTGPPLGGARAGRTAIFVAPANGGATRRLADQFSRARAPIWSPDGRGLLFFGRRTESVDVAQRNALLNLSRDIDFDWWWLPVAGGEPVPTGVYPALITRGVSFLPNTGGDAMPHAWGPDGVLFSATSGQALNLWRAQISTATGKLDGVPVRLTTGAGADVAPARDRSGRIVFQVRKSNEAVFALALEPGGAKSSARIERLATGWEFGVHRGSVSQDGRILAYPRHRPGSSEVWAKDLTTGSSRHLVTTPFTELNPVISADGSQVAYTVVENQRTSGHVVPAAGGATKKVCDNCIMQGWPGDNRHVIVEFPAEHPTLRVLDIVVGSSAGVFDMDGRVSRTFTTADDRWLVVGGQDVAWIAPFKPGQVATPANSTKIQLPYSDVITGRVAGSSSDGRQLYSLLGLDGFRCLYAQPVDPANHGVIGQPSLVQHFHDPGRQWGSTPMGNAVTARGFVFDQIETSSSIWLLESKAGDRTDGVK
jgi:hypothetical protein